MRLGVKIALVLLVLGGAMYLFVFPARTYLAQKQGIAAEARTVAVLKAEDAKLTSENSALQDNATIEQIARQEYGLVKQGQQAFMVLPVEPSPDHGPTAAQAGGLVLFPGVLALLVAGQARRSTRRPRTDWVPLGDAEQTRRCEGTVGSPASRPV